MYLKEQEKKIKAKKMEPQTAAKDTILERKSCRLISILPLIPHVPSTANLTSPIIEVHIPRITVMQ